MPDTTITDDLEAGEQLIRLTALRDCSFIPCARNGKKLDKSVAHRWATTGSRGAVLETMNTPTGRHTTRSAVMRFFQAITDGGDAESAARPTPTRRKQQIESAKRELVRAGID